MAVASLREKFLSLSLGTNHEQSDLQTGPAFRASACKQPGMPFSRFPLFTISISLQRRNGWQMIRLLLIVRHSLRQYAVTSLSIALLSTRWIMLAFCFPFLDPALTSVCVYVCYNNIIDLFIHEKMRARKDE